METKIHPPDEQWIIKTQGKILGPFTTNEIKTALQNRRLSPMDDIIEHFGRWKMLRDEMTFLQVTKELKNLASTGSEHTATSTQAMSSTTSGIKTSDITKSVTDKLFEEKTVTGAVPPPSIQFPNSDDRKATAKITAKVITVREKIAKSEAAAAYGAKEDYRFQKKASKSALTNWLIILGAGIFIGAGGWYYYDVQVKKQKSDNYFEIYNKGITTKSQGLYKKSLEHFQQAKQLNNTDVRVDFEMAPLLIAVQKQTVVGRRILEKSMSPSDNREASTISYNAIGLSHLFDGDLRSAQESLDKAYSIDPNNYWTLYNQSVLQYKNTDYVNAEQRFFNLIQKGKKTGEVLLGHSFSIIEAIRQGREPKRGYAAIVDELEGYLATNLPLRSQSQIMLAFTYVRMNRLDRAIQIVNSMLSEDLFVDGDFALDYLIDPFFTEWKNVLQYCDLLQSSLPQDGRSKSLFAFCQMQAGAQEAARQTMQDALVESPKSEVVNYVNAVVLKSVGQDAEAKLSLNSVTSGEIPGMFMLKGMICEGEGDFPCAETNYQKFLGYSKKNVSAYAGLARVAFKKGNKKQANDWIIKGQAVSKTYLPLWELQSR